MTTDEYNIRLLQLKKEINELLAESVNRSVNLKKHTIDDIFAANNCDLLFNMAVIARELKGS